MPATDNHIEITLMSRLHAGEESAFAEIFRQFNQKVFFFAKQFLDNTPDAEDVTAQAFVKLWNRRAEFASLDAIGAFLHVTVRHQCYDWLRHQQVKRAYEPELLDWLKSEQEGDFVLEEIRRELLDRIYAEVDRLPARMKEIFLLSYRDGLKPAAIARQLNLQVQTVKNQRLSAIRLLQQALQGHPRELFVISILFYC